jgi:transcriptional regulator with XRE-family HTH domain
MPSYVDDRMAKRVGRAIERARKARKWSARAAAAKADLDFGYLRRIEKGQSASAATYARLAGLFGLDLGELLSLGHGRTVARGVR